VPNLPAATSISGTISCAGQTPGHTTLRINGATGAGKVAGGINPVSVTCGPGSLVLVIGVVKVGHHHALIDMSVSNTALSLALEGTTATEYRAPAGTEALTTSGASVDSTATEQLAPGATAHTLHTLHVVGRVTCGKNSDG
jgi:hypothetical protein